ncbi:MAG: rhamnogalacturonan lyase [Lentisphaeria bacterium]|nr:rhamnogalacturonan lyase [Lentisphaeria bacterium]
MLKRSFYAAAATVSALAFLACPLHAQREPTPINPPTGYDFSKLKMERLGRGAIAVRQSPDEVFVTWRYLSRDARNTSFNVYRDGKKLNAEPVTEVTYYVDRNRGGGTYAVKPVVDGKELEEPSAEYRLPENAPVGYVNIPLDRPADGKAPNGEAYNYSPNDASAGDVDGDGEFEIILKWDPSNSRDNAHDGYTGNVYLDCYKLGRTEKMWRIDLGRNIRAGAHYTQFMVYDLDGDGIAEVVCKTADGTVDGTGKVIGDADADYRTPQGRILTGPEYLTVFSGKTGAALETIPYEVPRGNPRDWGDNYGNRCDRFLAAVGYLDGERPSVILCRGYYTRAYLAAYDWDGQHLVKRWTFDSDLPENRGYAGQGNHNLRVGDVDGDGRDEIVYGSCTIDDDGKGLYTTGLGHGDAMHLTQFAWDMPGLQVWCCHENKRDGATLRDAATGKILHQVRRSSDVGRCMAADIDPTNPGVEMWASGIPPQTVKGEALPGNPRGLSCNMAVWWDDDLCRELLDGNTVSKFNAAQGVCVPVMRFEGCSSNNGTKSTPCLQGDLFGDWREEVLMRTGDNRSLRLYVSTIPTAYRFHTFLEDPVYRISLATENVAYNQPTQPGFYFGPDLIFKAAKPDRGVLFRGTVLRVYVR